MAGYKIMRSRGFLKRQESSNHIFCPLAVRFLTLFPLLEFCPNRVFSNEGFNEEKLYGISKLDLFHMVKFEGDFLEFCSGKTRRIRVFLFCLVNSIMLR